MNFKEFFNESNYDIVTRKKIPHAQRGDLITRLKDRPNTYVSFTSLPKLGINPQSKFDTPVGIYAYPIGYVAKLWVAGRFAVPFAGDQPYAYVFETKNPANVLHFTSKQKYDYDDPETWGPEWEDVDLRPHYDTALIIHEYIQRIQQATDQYNQTIQQIQITLSRNAQQRGSEYWTGRTEKAKATKAYEDALGSVRVRIRRLLGSISPDARDYLYDAMLYFQINARHDWYGYQPLDQWDPDEMTKWIIEQYAQDQHRIAKTYPMEAQIRNLVHMSPQSWAKFKKKVVGPNQRIICPEAFAWNATRWLSGMGYGSFSKEQNPKVWTKLLLDLGVVGCHDHGTGTIHPNELTQAVFFRVTDLNVLDRIDNNKVTRYGKVGDNPNYSTDADEPYKPWMTATPQTGPGTLLPTVKDEMSAALAEVRDRFYDGIRDRLLNAYRALSIVKRHYPHDFGKARHDAYHPAVDIKARIEKSGLSPGDKAEFNRLLDKIIRTAKSGIKDYREPTVQFKMVDLDGDPDQ